MPFCTTSLAASELSPLHQPTSDLYTHVPGLRKLFVQGGLLPLPCVADRQGGVLLKRQPLPLPLSTHTLPTDLSHPGT